MVGAGRVRGEHNLDWAAKDFLCFNLIELEELNSHIFHHPHLEADIT
jgi:hypothetical protein